MREGKLIIVSGGARSGKSTFAENYVLHLDKQVGYLATAQALDPEMLERIEKHRQSRPANWKTFEEPLKVSQVIQANYQSTSVWLLDCITLYVSNLLLKILEKENTSGTYLHTLKIQETILTEIEELIHTIRETGITLVAVTNEVGWGLVPPDAVSRAYRDIAGKVNQRLAVYAAEVYLVTMGIPIRIKPQGEQRVEL